VDSVRRDAGVTLGVLAPVVVAALLVGVRDHIQNANVALILVVVVVAAGAIGGRMAGACSAVVSALSFVFFHTQPYLRLTIDTADDIETTGLLLIVGLVVGHLSAGTITARASASESSLEIRRIHRVAERAARGEDAAVVIKAAEDELSDLLRLRSCRFEAQPVQSILPRLERSGQLNTRVWRFRDNGFELPPEGVELPVYGRGQPLGRFVLDPIPGVGVTLEQRVVAVAVADQVGAALAAPSMAGKGDGHG
jgi:K+-sensing histidine kinase KdpD